MKTPYTPSQPLRLSFLSSFSMITASLDYTFLVALRLLHIWMFTSKENIPDVQFLCWHKDSRTFQNSFSFLNFQFTKEPILKKKPLSCRALVKEGN